jgi:hypothetical protein
VGAVFRRVSVTRSHLTLTCTGDRETGQRSRRDFSSGAVLWAVAHDELENLACAPSLLSCLRSLGLLSVRSVPRFVSRETTENRSFRLAWLFCTCTARAQRPPSRPHSACSSRTCRGAGAAVCFSRSQARYTLKISQQFLNSAHYASRDARLLQ